MNKIPARDLANLLCRVDNKVLADIAGSTSSSLLKHLIYVLHARPASKLLKLAPRTLSKVLPAIKQVSPDKSRQSFINMSTGIDVSMTLADADSMVMIPRGRLYSEVEDTSEDLGSASQSQDFGCASQDLGHEVYVDEHDISEEGVQSLENFLDLDTEEMFEEPPSTVFL